MTSLYSHDCITATATIEVGSFRYEEKTEGPKQRSYSSCGIWEAIFKYWWKPAGAVGVLLPRSAYISHPAAIFQSPAGAAIIWLLVTATVLFVVVSVKFRWVTEVTKSLSAKSLYVNKLAAINKLLSIVHDKHVCVCKASTGWLRIKYFTIQYAISPQPVVWF